MIDSVFYLFRSPSPALCSLLVTVVPLRLCLPVPGPLAPWLCRSPLRPHPIPRPLSLKQDLRFSILLVCVQYRVAILFKFFQFSLGKRLYLCTYGAGVGVAYSYTSIPSSSCFFSFSPPVLLFSLRCWLFLS